MWRRLCRPFRLTRLSDATGQSLRETGVRRNPGVAVGLGALAPWPLALHHPPTQTHYIVDRGPGRTVVSTTTTVYRVPCEMT